jgi:hypothetical protein
MKKILFATSILVLFTLLSTSLIAYNSSAAYVSLSLSGYTTPSVVEPGEKANLILTITNNGNDYARDLKLKIKPNSFIIPDEREYDLQTIAPTNSIVVTVPITITEAASEGTTALVFSLEYQEGSTSGTQTAENSISISITRRVLIQIENVTFSKDVIQRGDEVLMLIDFKNEGRGRIKDMRVSLEDYTLPFVYTDSGDYLGEMSPHTSAIAHFKFIVKEDASTNAYNLPINFSYYDDNGILHTDRKFVGVKVSGIPDFVVGLDSTKNMVSGNGAAEASVSISNRGTANANFLYVKYDTMLNLESYENYVGNLEPDDSQTVSIKMNLAKTSPGKYPINIELFYKDPYNNEYSQKKTVEVTVSNYQFQISPTFTAIILILVIVIVYWKRAFIRKKLSGKK